MTASTNEINDEVSTSGQHDMISEPSPSSEKQDQSRMNGPSSLKITDEEGDEDSKASVPGRSSPAGTGATRSEAEEDDEDAHYDPGESAKMPENGENPWETPRQEPADGAVQPRVVPPMGKPTRHTNQLEFLKKEVLPAVFKHKHAWPFTKPVDSKKLNCPVRSKYFYVKETTAWKHYVYFQDYHQRIKRPMDLGTVKRRLDNVYYYSAKQCIQV